MTIEAIPEDSRRAHAMTLDFPSSASAVELTVGAHAAPWIPPLTPYQPVGIVRHGSIATRFENEVPGRGRTRHPRQGLRGRDGGRDLRGSGTHQGQLLPSLREQGRARRGGGRPFRGG